MKLQGYQSENIIANPARGAVQVSGSAMAYGGDGSGLKALSKAAGDWADVIYKEKLQEDKENYLAAVDQYNKARNNILYNSESGVLNAKAESAAGITDSYNAQEQKLRDDIFKNTKFNFSHSKDALAHTFNQYNERDGLMVTRHRQQQMDIVRDSVFKGNVANFSVKAEADFSDPEAVAQTMADAGHIASITYGGNNGGEAVVNAKTKETQGQIANAIIAKAISHGRYDLAENYMTTYGNSLAPNARQNFDRVIYVKKQDAWEREKGKEMFSRFGGNVSLIREELAKSSGYAPSEKENAGPMNYDQQDRILQYARREFNIAKEQERNYYDGLFDSFGSQLKQMQRNGVSADNALSWVEAQAGADIKSLEIGRRAYSIAYGGGGGSARGGRSRPMSNEVKGFLEDKLRDGTFQNKSEFLTAARDTFGMSMSELEGLGKTYEDYLAGRGVFKYDFGKLTNEVLEDRFKGAEKDKMARQVESYMRVFVRDYRAEHNGEDPSQEAVKRASKEALTKRVRGSYVVSQGFWSDEKSSLNYSDAELAAVGIRSIEQIAPDTFSVQFSNGKMSGNFNGSFVEDLVNGARSW